MNPQLKQRLDEMLQEMLFASEEDRMALFQKLNASFCQNCGSETGEGTHCYCTDNAA